MAWYGTLPLADEGDESARRLTNDQFRISVRRALGLSIPCRKRVRGTNGGTCPTCGNGGLDDKGHHTLACGTSDVNTDAGRGRQHNQGALAIATALEGMGFKKVMKQVVVGQDAAGHDKKPDWVQKAFPPAGFAELTKGEKTRAVEEMRTKAMYADYTVHGARRANREELTLARAAAAARNGDPHELTDVADNDKKKQYKDLVETQMHGRFVPFCVCGESGMLGKEAKQAIRDAAAWAVATQRWRSRLYRTDAAAQEALTKRVYEVASVTFAREFANRVLSAGRAGEDVIVLDG